MSNEVTLADGTKGVLGSCNDASTLLAPIKVALSAASSTPAGYQAPTAGRGAGVTPRDNGWFSEQVSLFPLVHVLKANGATEAPFADFTLCGLPVDAHTSAMWPGEPLRGFHWGKPYRVKGSWCVDCRNIEKEAAEGVCPRCGMKPATPSGLGHAVLCARSAKKEESSG